MGLKIETSSSLLVYSLLFTTVFCEMKLVEARGQVEAQGYLG